MSPPDMQTYEDFVVRLVRFGHHLRRAGLEVGPGRLQDALISLTAVDATSRDDVYWALRCTLCSHHVHLEIFDGAFQSLWCPSGEDIETSARTQLGTIE